MAMLQAIRGHIERVAKACGAGWHPDCASEMHAEDVALQVWIQQLEGRVRAQELVSEELLRRIAIVDSRIDAVALAVEFNRQGTAELLENIGERIESNRVDVSDRIDHMQQQIDQPDWRQRR